MIEDSNSNSIKLDVHSAQHLHFVDEPNLWLKQNFSHDWFSDALSEAKSSSGKNSRRREIVFAVCFAESYLLEWVRDEVLQQNYEKLFDYFKKKRGIKVRWKEVIKKLAKDGLIKKSPDFNQEYWKDFIKLVKYRDGLVHANVSRPDSTLLEIEKRPSPTAHELDNLKPGWPTNAVKELVLRLHDAIGTNPPPWLLLF